MRKRITSFASLALALSVKASVPDVMLIADRELTVSYVSDNGIDCGEIKLVDQRQRNLDFYGGEYFGSVYDGASFTAPDVSGCRFGGWYTFAKNVGQYDDTSVGNCTVRMTDEKVIGSNEYTRSAKTSFACYGDYVLCLKYSYLPLTVSFNGNGADSGTMDPVTNKNYDSSFTLPANGYGRTGYAFGGWSNRVGRTFSDRATVSGADFWETDHFESELHALWNETSYAITCDPQGPGPASATFEEVFSVPDAAKTGYEFKGWKVEEADFSTARYGSSESSVNATLTSGTVCRGEDGKTWFRRLDSTGGTVRLVAQFEARGITVTFNNHGATSGETTLVTTYGQSYPAVNCPKKEGSMFTGYEIGGRTYWDDQGQPVRVAWDIPTNCTAHAQWNAKTFHVEYDTNGGSGTIFSQLCTNGVETTLSDGTGFSRPGCTLLGWSTSPSASEPEYELGGTYRLDSEADKKLFAIWEVSYYIGFDGFGATSGMMEPQKFRQGEQKELTRNRYAKTGYSFGGWAKDEAGARALTPTYKDGQMFAGAVDVPGGTNWLYAVWNTNAYHVAFEANGGTGPLPDTIDCLYDHPVTIPAPSADLVKPPFVFSGWRDPVADVVYADLPAVVSNLCTAADGTNTLSAVWRLSDLSEALHCTNLYWESVAHARNPGSVNGWMEIRGEDEGFERSGSCARQSDATEMAIPQMLTARLVESGTLSFRWKGTRISFNVSQKRDDTTTATRNLEDSGAGEWNYFSTNLVVTAETWVHIWNYTQNGAADIDRMMWMPKGTNPEPKDGEDNVTISSVAISEGRFKLLFTSDERFDYNLLTNADLSINSWGVMTNEVGTGGTIIFEPQIIEDRAQLFYKVETIQRK